MQAQSGFILYRIGKPNTDKGLIEMASLRLSCIVMK
jgi:hypothetical protein